MLQGPRIKTQELNQKFVVVWEQLEHSEQQNAKQEATSIVLAETNRTQPGEAVTLKSIKQKIFTLMKYIAEWGRKKTTTSADAHQAGEQDDVIANLNEEMRMACGEMREKRAIDEFKNDLIEYIQGAVPRWIEFDRREPIAQQTDL